MRKRAALHAVLLLVVCGCASRGGGDLRSIIESRAWARGIAVCEGFATSEAARAGDGNLTAPYLADFAAQCAVIAHFAGDERARHWWWSTAVALDPAAATASLSSSRLPRRWPSLEAARQLVSASDFEPRHDEVILLDGSVVSGQACRVTAKPKPPLGFTTAVDGSRGLIRVELVVAADGSIRQPLVVSTTAPPLFSFQALQYIRQWTISPAVVAGQPVDSACQIHIAVLRSS